MRSDIQKRIARLELKLRRAAIVLFFDDGTQQQIPLDRGQDVLDLFNAALNEPTSALAEAFRRSVRAIEPGGSRLIEVFQSLDETLAEQREAN
jgi:hypothetical protein